MSTPHDEDKNVLDSGEKAHQRLRDFLADRVPAFRRLRQLREESWKNTDADTFFDKKRTAADTANEQVCRGFYNMMLKIATQLNNATSALTLPTPHPSLLDLCMAPGGFTHSVLQRNPTALARGVTLPASRSGHRLLLPRWAADPRIEVQFRDITLLAAELGVAPASIPADHPDAANFSPDRPFLGMRFDLVFCDGQVLRTHARHRAPYRERGEAARLTLSQLVLALQRVRDGGTLVVLMHKLDAWRSVRLLSTVAGFAEIQLFKPRPFHAKQSSFYLVAKNVRPESGAAVEAVGRWKREWAVATFGTEEEKKLGEEVSDREVDAVLAEFGEQLVRLGPPIWEVQADALEAAGKSGWGRSARRD